MTTTTTTTTTVKTTITTTVTTQQQHNGTIIVTKITTTKTKTTPMLLINLMIKVIILNFSISKLDYQNWIVVGGGVSTLSISTLASTTVLTSVSTYASVQHHNKKIEDEGSIKSVDSMNQLIHKCLYSSTLNRNN
ncbi:hypothetical protein ACTA71_002958 [Dictyostelium dimigraforme]